MTTDQVFWPKGEVLVCDSVDMTTKLVLLLFHVFVFHHVISTDCKYFLKLCSVMLQRGRTSSAEKLLEHAHKFAVFSLAG